MFQKNDITLCLEPAIAGKGITLFLFCLSVLESMAGPENPMAYLLESGLRRMEQERPDVSNDSRYQELKAQLLRTAEGHFREISSTYATIVKTQCHCGGQLEPVDHEFGKSKGMIYDSVIAKCKKCGQEQTFQFPKDGFISEARSAMALRDYLLKAFGIDYATVVMGEQQQHGRHGVRA